MLTDYKISRIIRGGENGDEYLVRFYEGEITTKDEMDNNTKNTQPVTRYRRTMLLREETISISNKGDNEIFSILKNELSKDKKRDSIYVQKITPPVTK